MRLNLNYAIIGLLACGCQTGSQQVAQQEEEVCAPGARAMVITAPTTNPAVAKFGGEQRLTPAETVPVSAAIASPDTYADKYVRIKGVVGSVCPKKGCWLRVINPDAGTKGGNVFVKFPDPPEGMLIPMAAVGHEVTVEGTLKNATISEAAARHYLQDAGVSQQGIDKIVGPQKQLMVSGPAVEIEGVAQNAE